MAYSWLLQPKRSCVSNNDKYSNRKRNTLRCTGSSEDLGMLSCWPGRIVPRQPSLVGIALCCCYCERFRRLFSFPNCPLSTSRLGDQELSVVVPSPSHWKDVVPSALGAVFRRSLPRVSLAQLTREAGLLSALWCLEMPNPVQLVKQEECSVPGRFVLLTCKVIGCLRPLVEEVEELFHFQLSLRMMDVVGII